MPEFVTHSDEETIALGVRLARELLPEQGVVLLSGTLGAGKTTLVKGIAEGRGAAARDEVSSPTYTLIHEYGDPVNVYHADLYRLDTIEEVRGLGIEDLFDAPALLIVEWGDRFPALWPAAHVEIRITAEGEDERRFQVTGVRN